MRGGPPGWLPLCLAPLDDLRRALHALRREQPTGVEVMVFHCGCKGYKRIDGFWEPAPINTRGRCQKHRRWAGQGIGKAKGPKGG